MQTYKEEKNACLAVSRAGHDKGKLYLVLTYSPEAVLLVDGISRTLDKPKKKKPMHVQIICHLDEDLKQKMQEVRTDEQVREVLQAYRGRL